MVQRSLMDQVFFSFHFEFYHLIASSQISSYYPRGINAATLCKREALCSHDVFLQLA